MRQFVATRQVSAPSEGTFDAFQQQYFPGVTDPAIVAAADGRGDGRGRGRQRADVEMQPEQEQGHAVQARHQDALSEDALSPNLNCHGKERRLRKEQSDRSPRRTTGQERRLSVGRCQSAGKRGASRQMYASRY